MPTDTLFYAAHGADCLKRLETALTAARRRCNLMHVKSAQQAAAILRRDARDKAPDLILIWGAATDARAAELARAIREDEALRGARFIVLADDGEAVSAEPLLHETPQ